MRHPHAYVFADASWIRVGDGPLHRVGQDVEKIWFSGIIGRPMAWSRTPREPLKEDPVPFRPEAVARIKSLTRAQLEALDPTVNCLPRGVPKCSG